MRRPITDRETLANPGLISRSHARLQSLALGLESIVSPPPVLTAIPLIHQIAAQVVPSGLWPL